MAMQRVKCWRKASRVLVRGCRAGNQTYIVLHQAIRVCRVNDRATVLSIGRSMNHKNKMGENV